VRWPPGQVLTLALVLAIAGVVVSAFAGEHGVAHLLRLRAARRTLAESHFRLLEENARLRRDIARLRSDDLYLEELARRELGLVRPNEVVVRAPHAAAATPLPPRR
jgi:cell division protein FtsB